MIVDENIHVVVSDSMNAVSPDQPGKDSGLKTGTEPEPDRTFNVTPVVSEDRRMNL